MLNLRLLVQQYNSSSKSHLFTYYAPTLDCDRTVWKIICATPNVLDLLWPARKLTGQVKVKDKEW